MNGTCEYSQDFPILVKTGPTDPFWDHLQDCPDCRALLNAYEQFGTVDARPDLDFDLEEADRELAGRLAAAMTPDGEQTAPARVMDETHGGSILPDWLLGKEFWYGMAAIFVLGTGLFLGQDLLKTREPVFQGDSGLVRGQDSGAGYPCLREQDQLLVSWPDVEGADAVRIVFYDAAMTELGEFLDSGPGPLRLGAAAVPEEAVFGQVFHLSRGDVLRRGPVFAVPAAH